MVGLLNAMTDPHSAKDLTYLPKLETQHVQEIGTLLGLAVGCSLPRALEQGLMRVREYRPLPHESWKDGVRNGSRNGFSIFR